MAVGGRRSGVVVELDGAVDAAELPRLVSAVAHRLPTNAQKLTTRALPDLQYISLRERAENREIRRSQQRLHTYIVRLLKDGSTNMLDLKQNIMRNQYHNKTQ